MTETDLERPCFLILQCKLISAVAAKQNCFDHYSSSLPLPKTEGFWVKDDPFKACFFLNILSLGVISRHTGIGHSEVIIFGEHRNYSIYLDLVFSPHFVIPADKQPD